jgi:hypothetical protein
MPGDLDGMDLVREVEARWPPVLVVIASGHIKPPQALSREVDDLMRKSSGSD